MNTRGVSVALFLILSAWQARAQSDDPNALIDHRLRRLAGENPIDCGWIKPGGNPKLSIKCARRAIKKKQPFVVRFDSNGIEGLVSRGFVGTSAGNVYWLDVDSYNCADPTRNKDLCPTLVKCPKPVRIFYLIDPQGQAYDHRCVPLKQR